MGRIWYGSLKERQKCLLVTDSWPDTRTFNDIPWSFPPFGPARRRNHWATSNPGPSLKSNRFNKLYVTDPQHKFKYLVSLFFCRGRFHQCLKRFCSKQKSRKFKSQNAFCVQLFRSVRIPSGCQKYFGRLGSTGLAGICWWSRWHVWTPLFFTGEVPTERVRSCLHGILSQHLGRALHTPHIF